MGLNFVVRPSREQLDAPNMIIASTLGIYNIDTTEEMLLYQREILDRYDAILKDLVFD